MSLQKYGPMAGWVLSISAVVALAYNLGLRAGYFVDEARAAEIAKQVMVPEELARLEFVLETKMNRLRLLERLSETTADDRIEIGILRDEIKDTRDRIAQLKKQL